MSTPPEREQPMRRPALEPTYVQQRRRTEALAELVREFREDQQAVGPDENYESVRLSSAHLGETEELPPVLVGENYAAYEEAKPAAPTRQEPGRRPGRAAGQGYGHATGLRRAAVVAAVVAAALVGFAVAMLLPGGDSRSQAGAASSATAPVAQAPSGAADPDGTGILREGDNGPEVAELQERLLHIPDVYDSGVTSGTYDPTLTAAVARFQLWYGIRGDETGVYGDDTRAALESRT
ncbi:peptidoglycan-binding protein [Streptomyces sp. NPDC005808]|uniref:peptidoglycan-binding domain-containing protein n=1 Tax=Streptomyces sp. NPDC005808 TaxID=3364734 RepID=UPI00368AE1EF